MRYLFLLSLLLLPSLPSSAIEVTVSPNGPITTLKAARDAVRASRAADRGGSTCHC